MKYCPKCAKNLEESEFSIHKGVRLQSYCKSCQSKYAAEYRESHRTRLVENTRKWREIHKKPRKLTEQQKAEEALRRTVRNMLDSNGIRINKYLGYTGKQLVAKISSLLTQPLSWDNYNDNWTISYLIPLNSFDLTNKNEWKKAAALENIKIQIKHAN